ncbi:arginine deiminase family protein [Halobacillus litoralis]|uniref:dimethylarginine dimethylaminohydrolase family protein n=1 Tax=Halobacillus litoralis TaxID=45668 RepID=UPI001CFE9204|nr:arginine deiminase family protein [Halobacillus litoralis]WLR48263.1 arginine deiminase family protein [Halobacillus litoralis]
MVGTASENSVQCNTEYSPLKKVVVAKPSYMKITDIINETQKHYQNKNINIKTALQQHEHFVQVLEEHQIEVIQLASQPDLHEQVFTRDIGFTIHHRLFISSMSEKVRKEETDVLQSWARENDIEVEEDLPSSIEGGDIVVDGNTVWVGETKRTSGKSISELQSRLLDLQVIPVPLRGDILHLDCVFNIIDQSTAILYPPAFTKNSLKSISARYKVIEVTKKEQFTMGPNVLSIGSRKVISLPQNEQLNTQLEKYGFHVIPVDLSEIIKSGGSFRCCTLPLKRT